LKNVEPLLKKADVSGLPTIAVNYTTPFGKEYKNPFSIPVGELLELKFDQHPDLPYSEYLSLLYSDSDESKDAGVCAAEVMKTNIELIIKRTEDDYISIFSDSAERFKSSVQGVPKECAEYDRLKRMSKDASYLTSNINKKIISVYEKLQDTIEDVKDNTRRPRIKTSVDNIILDETKILEYLGYYTLCLYKDAKVLECVRTVGEQSMDIKTIIEDDARIIANSELVDWCKKSGERGRDITLWNSVNLGFAALVAPLSVFYLKQPKHAYDVAVSYLGMRSEIVKRLRKSAEGSLMHDKIKGLCDITSTEAWAAVAAGEKPKPLPPSGVPGRNSEIFKAEKTQKEPWLAQYASDIAAVGGALEDIRAAALMQKADPSPIVDYFLGACIERAEILKAQTIAAHFKAVKEDIRLGLADRAEVLPHGRSRKRLMEDFYTRKGLDISDGEVLAIGMLDAGEGVDDVVAILERRGEERLAVFYAANKEEVAKIFGGRRA